MLGPTVVAVFIADGHDANSTCPIVAKASVSAKGGSTSVWK